MRNIIHTFRVVSVVFIIALVPTSVLAESYSIDVSHSRIEFKVRHLGISTVRGNFAKFSGQFDYDTESLASSKAKAEIETATIDTGLKKRDKHLRSPEFLDVAKYPKMSFVSKKIKPLGKDKFDVVGDLTLHGITREVVLHVKLGGVVKDPWGNTRAAFSAETQIDRRKFGLTWNKLLEAGGLVVDNIVKIEIEVEGIQRKES